MARIKNNWTRMRSAGGAQHSENLNRSARFSHKTKDDRGILYEGRADTKFYPKKKRR